ncbi:MAG: ABC transporter substrate-binding protein [Candidatus Faecousia sp.]|nr:ABC transporter substrate-binding protein [Candidatus Faecousia sp.]
MKKLISLLLALSLVLSLGLWAVAEGADLTDQLGRAVTLEQTPQRIVSGYYISSSALIALGLEDKLVGIEAKANKRPIYSLSAPALIDLPNVGTAKEFDLEGCIALNPDLVILPAKLKNAAETLEQLGIPVLLVNPESGEQLEQMIALLGQATGTQERAEELLDFIAGQRENLETLLAEAEKPRVYLAGNSALLSTAGANMYQSDMMVLAGGENVAAELSDTYWAEISYEQLLAWNPEYIVLASDASYTVEEVLADPNLADCTAVKNGNVLQLPGDAEAWDSPVPSGILGSVWLAARLHGDLLPEDQAEEIIASFYETFYGFSYGEG